MLPKIAPAAGVRLKDAVRLASSCIRVIATMKRLAIVVLCAAVLLGTYYILSAENAHRAARPEVAGWDDIDECGSLKSFDGTKTLDFERSHKVSLTEKSSEGADKPERKVAGTWAFDEEKERYTVSFADSAVDYALVKPHDSSVCILAPGDAVAVNLRESWFGRIESE
jgi:hypothetical protein